MNSIAVADFEKPSRYKNRIIQSLQASKGRAVGPDFFRALAILLVMLVHLPLEATPSLLEGVRNYGWLGVDIFFVLSGYLIGTQLFKEAATADAIGLRAFYARRAFRIFPAYFVVLGLLAALPVLRDSSAMQPLWRFATFTVNLGLDPRTGNAFSQAWTLSVEEQFYVVLPLLVLLLRRRVDPWGVLAAVSLAVLTGVFLRFGLWEAQVAPLVDLGKPRDAFAVYLRDIYYPTYTRLDGLLFGVVLAAARWFQPEICRRWAPPILALPLGTVLIATALVLISDRGPLAGTNLFLVFQAPYGATFGFPLFSGGVALVLAGLLDLEDWLVRLPLPGVGTVATLSYSLYLTHKSAFHVDRLIFGADVLQGPTGFVVYLLTSFAVAALLWVCVERTFLRLRDRVLVGGPSRGRRPGGDAEPAAEVARLP